METEHGHNSRRKRAIGRQLRDAVINGYLDIDTIARTRTLRRKLRPTPPDSNAIETELDRSHASLAALQYVQYGGVRLGRFDGRTAAFAFEAEMTAAFVRNNAQNKGGLVHHSDRGSEYVSIRYTERLAEAGIEPLVGGVGDSYDNALAETINGPYKAEVIQRLGPWKNMEAVEWQTLKWVDWFNNRRLLEPIGNIPPAEAEQSTMRDTKCSIGSRKMKLVVSGETGAIQFQSQN